MISVFDHGFLFGDMVYEVLRTYGNVPFALCEHLQRLSYSAVRVGVHVPWSTREIAQEIIAGLELSLGKQEETKIRLVVTNGTGESEERFADNLQPNLLIFFMPLACFPEKFYREGITLAVVEPESSDWPRAKTNRYSSPQRALQEIKKNDAFEGILPDRDGWVGEAVSSSLFMVKNGKLCTPHLRAGILDGITRRLTMRLALENSLEVDERAVSLQEFLDADEIFITATSKEIMPVSAICGRRSFASVPGRCTSLLMKAFQNHVLSFRVRYPDIRTYAALLPF